MSLTLIAQERFETMPWKNGGGVTTQILTSPEGAGLDSFDWRISMARVESDGPFSVFAGIDRTLSILEGGGLVLHPTGRGPVTLTRSSPPYAFPADLPLEAQLTAGPITDLNVMTRRGRARAHVSRMEGHSSLTLPCLGETTLILTNTDVDATAQDQRVTAQAGDLIRLEGSNSTLTITTVNPHDTISLTVIDLWVG